MVSLRAMHPADRERMLDILTDNIIKKTYMLPDFENRESAVPLFERLMEMSKNESKYIRAIDLDGCLIGFLNHTDIQGQRIELGYVIHPDFHGRGYMTHALCLAMTELFTLGYNQIITGAFSSNRASIRVMEKCGMLPMKQTEQISYRGQTHTCVYYEKRNEDIPC